MFVIKRRSFIIISVLLATVIAIIVCVGAITLNPAGEMNSDRIKIVLDAGHGGIDAGVNGVNTGVKESELNLKVVKKLEGYLVAAGMEVTLTRNSDAGLYGIATKNLKKKDMEKRRDIINSVKPDLVISIHMNKYSISTRRGAQVFYKRGDEVGKVLAKCVQDSFNKMEEASRECSVLTGDYYILNCSRYPSIIAECGFLSSPEDEALLIKEEYQDALAFTIFQGVVEYFSKTADNI